MPELPEVEVYRQFVEKTSVKKEIDHIEVLEEKILKNTTESKLNKRLAGRNIIKTNRRGKYLFLELDNGKGLEVHFGMTGHFEYVQDGINPSSARAILYFKDGEKLVYVDRRKIGHLSEMDSFELMVEDHKLGADALEISFEELHSKLSASKAKIKAALMDQELVSGIGNVYADEILFQAKIHPESKASALKPNHLKNIYRYMVEVMEVAIKYIKVQDGYEKGRKMLPAEYLLPVRKEGEDCPGDCGGKVEMIKVAGRTTYFCPNCQELIK